ncbi:MAG: EAL domain-containing protein [Candidatus Eremiobacteraeota bacterium]|nr:EAL domain-containing protein [Candidatus Eremiobacteraeota bacterium]
MKKARVKALLRGTTRTAAVFLAIYIIAWLAADIAGVAYANGTGLGVWYLNAALDIVLFSVLGWRWWPLPVALMALSFLISPGERWGSVAVNVAAQAPYEFILALFTNLTMSGLRVRFPLKTARDVALFTAFVCIAGPIVAKTAFVAVFTLLDPASNPLTTFFEQFLRGTIADTTAIIVLVPVITQFMAWGTPSERSEAVAKLDRRNLLLGLVVTFGAVVLEYVIGQRIGRTLGEFSLVPLAWLSITYGMRGAAFGVLVADVTATLMHIYLRIPINSQIEYQGYLVASALLALLLGAIATERQGLFTRLQHAAYFDRLTDLPNTRQLMDWITRTRGKSAVLALIDIADLRVLNEGVGRERVDGLLVDFAARLRSGLAIDYFVARVGSGEFAVAIAQPLQPNELILAIQALLAHPFEMEGAHVFVEATIGAAAFEKVQDPHELLRRADLAVRRAKTTASQIAVFGLEDEPNAPPLLVVELHRAAEQHEFVPFFQPIYRHQNGRWNLAGAEVLMRWQHPQRGVLVPADFIELLERLSVCNRVGWDILDESLRLAMKWRAVVPDFSVWVNFFPRQIFDPQCVERIRSAIENAHAAPDALVVEITERIVVRDELDVTAVVRALRALGIRTAIDDFGTGGSSLGRVREVPAQILKIDHSFVNRSEVDPKALSVASTVVRLASELGMSALAEGVENALQVDAMLAIGCEYGQGYALGHPAPAALFERILTQSIAS